MEKYTKKDLGVTEDILHTKYLILNTFSLVARKLLGSPSASLEVILRGFWLFWFLPEGYCLWDLVILQDSDCYRKFSHFAHALRGTG